MLKNGIPAGGNHGDNAAYIGSVEESLANRRSFSLRLQRESVESHNEGYKKGEATGYEKGYVEGQNSGYNEGWEKAIEAGNKEITAAAGYIRQHIKEKEELKTKLNERADLISKLATRIEELEEENKALKKDSEPQKKANVDLRELVTSLRSTTERLQVQVEELDAKYKARTQQYAELLWQYNKTMVVVSAVSSVLDELTKENTPQAREARALFVEHYAQEVRNGLERGTIKVAPDLDPAFKRMLPKTQALISDLLAGSTVELKATNPAKEEMSLNV